MGFGHNNIMITSHPLDNSSFTSVFNKKAVLLIFRSTSYSTCLKFLTHSESWGENERLKWG